MPRRRRARRSGWRQVRRRHPWRRSGRSCGGNVLGRRGRHNAAPSAVHARRRLRHMHRRLRRAPPQFWMVKRAVVRAFVCVVSRVTSAVKLCVR